jgi:hypothetical protein
MIFTRVPVFWIDVTNRERVQRQRCSGVVYRFQQERRCECIVGITQRNVPPQLVSLTAANVGIDACIPSFAPAMRVREHMCYSRRDRPPECGVAGASGSPTHTPGRKRACHGSFKTNLTSNHTLTNHVGETYSPITCTPSRGTQSEKKVLWHVGTATHGTADNARPTTTPFHNIDSVMTSPQDGTNVDLWCVSEHSRV